MFAPRLAPAARLMLGLVLLMNCLSLDAGGLIGRCLGCSLELVGVLTSMLLSIVRFHQIFKSAA